MTVKEKTAELLTDHRGDYISGNDIAKELGVSRNAVWKAVKLLEADGYAISAVTNRGYCIPRNADILDKRTVYSYISDKYRHDIDVRQKITSTNTVLKELADLGAKEGTVIISAEQSAGKGRMNRRFISELEGVYFSFLLRPRIPASKALMITTAAAVAASRAIEEISGRRTDIKWVNDLFIGGKKVCGILTEASCGLEGGGLDYAVCGIGVNVRPPQNGFADELIGIADAVLPQDNDIPDARARIAAGIINNFFDLYYGDGLENGSYIDEYRSRSIVIGKNVRLINGDNIREAYVYGIDDECRLKVRYPDGTPDTISSGEVSLRMIG